MRLNKNILQGNVNSVFFRYLVPSMSAMIMLSANYFIDTLCIGQKLGENGLAALNLAWPVTTVLYALGYLMGAGGGAIYAAYMAQEKQREARGVYTGALATLAVMAVIVTAACVIFIEPLITLLGGTGDIRQGVKDYVWWVVVFAFAYMGDCFYVSFLRNDRAPKLSMSCTLLACSLNIILDITFIWVFNWGMAGAAAATSVSVTASVILGVVSTFRKSSGLRICFSAVKVKEIISTVKVGMSTFLTEIDGGLVTFVYNTVLIRIAGSGSTSAIAVYGIVTNVNTIVLAAINGISSAMQPLVSANYGAGLRDRTKKFFKVARRFSMILAFIVVLLIEWKAEFIVTFFLEPGDVFMAQAAFAVRLVAFSYLLASINMLVISYFQAVQAVVPASCGSILRTLILPIIFVIALAALMGVNGVWFASICIEIATAMILWVTYTYLQKKKGFERRDISYEYK